MFFSNPLWRFQECVELAELPETNNKGDAYSALASEGFMLFKDKWQLFSSSLHSDILKDKMYLSAYIISQVHLNIPLVSLWNVRFLRWIGRQNFFFTVSEHQFSVSKERKVLLPINTNFRCGIKHIMDFSGCWLFKIEYWALSYILISSAYQEAGNETFDFWTHLNTSKRNSKKTYQTEELFERGCKCPAPKSWIDSVLG